MTQSQTKISDFAICRKLLDTVCNRAHCSFVDLDVKFATAAPHLDDQGAIVLPESNKLSKTLFGIVQVYLDNFQRICGIDLDRESREDVSKFMFSLARGMSMWDKHVQSDDKNEFIPQWLDQYPVVWILFRSIFVPLLHAPLENVRVIAGHSSRHDVARFIKSESGNEYVFVNLDIESQPIRAAYLLYESLKHFTNNPDSCLQSIFADRYLKDKFISFASMAYDNDEDTANFLGILAILSNSDAVKDETINTIAANNPQIKMSQSFSTNFWFLGLMEKMLESDRGMDWTVYNRWKPYTDELNRKIEIERRKRGLDHVPQEILLRIHGDEFSIADKSRTLQALLSDDRVW